MDINQRLTAHLNGQVDPVFARLENGEDLSESNPRESQAWKAMSNSSLNEGATFQPKRLND